MPDDPTPPPDHGSNPRERDEDPYADVDVESLPDWWREAIEEFEAHDLRPYRPPRFADGALLHEVVEPLETELDVDIDFIGVNVTAGDDWTVRVDGEPICDIGRRRTAEAYTQFELTSEAFEAMVREAV